MPSLHVLLLLILLELSGTAPLSLSTRSDLSCPGSDSVTVVANGKQYKIECDTDRWGGDMPEPNGAYVGVSPVSMLN